MHEEYYEVSQWTSKNIDVRLQWSNFMVPFNSALENFVEK